MTEPFIKVSSGLPFSSSAALTPPRSSRLCIKRSTKRTHARRSRECSGAACAQPSLSPGVVDEYTFCKYQTAAVAKAGTFRGRVSAATRGLTRILIPLPPAPPPALLSHYKTFITESDIQQIAAAGQLASPSVPSRAKLTRRRLGFGRQQASTISVSLSVSGRST